MTLTTKEERRRAALENFLSYYLSNEFDKEQLIEFFIFNLSDSELENLVKQFNNGISNLPPVVPNSKYDVKRESPTRNVTWEYV